MFVVDAVNLGEFRRDYMIDSAPADSGGVADQGAVLTSRPAAKSDAARQGGEAREDVLVLAGDGARPMSLRGSIDGVGAATATPALAGLTEIGEQVAEVPIGHSRQAANAGHAHGPLGRAAGDHLGVGVVPEGVLPWLWQEIADHAMDQRLDTVGVAFHRGLRADAVVVTGGFGLSALLSSGIPNPVESIIRVP